VRPVTRIVPVAGTLSGTAALTCDAPGEYALLGLPCVGFLERTRAGREALAEEKRPIARHLHFDAGRAIITQLAGEQAAVLPDGPERFAGSWLARCRRAVGRVEGLIAHRSFARSARTIRSHRVISPPRFSAKPEFSLAHTAHRAGECTRLLTIARAQSLREDDSIPMKPKPKRERRVTAERRTNPRSGRRSGDSQDARDLRGQRIVEYQRTQKVKKRA
jgi:hypothetical protein